MNKQEFGRIVMALKSYYPDKNLFPSNEACDLWYERLSDLDYMTTQTAVNKWAETNKWPPAISEIREMVTKVTGSRVPDWNSEWENVQRLIRTMGYYSKTDALEQMSEATRKTVSCIGWESLCHDEDQTANRANFRMVYENEAKKANERAQMSPKLLSIIDGMKAIEKGESA